METKLKTEKQAWQPLRELALNTPYTMGYLSLMARRKQLKVKKVGRVWHSTMEYIKEFEERMQERKELRKKQLQESYREKVKREVLKEIEEESSQENLHTSPRQMAGYSSQEETESPLKRGGSPTARRGVLSSDDTIFDEVQKELEEVLEEIRNRERRLRQEYLAYRGIHGGDGAENYGNAALAREKRETEEISENLIMDLGKLLNTANKIHEEESSGENADNIDNSTYEGVSIPVRNQNIHRGHISTMNMDLPVRGNKMSQNLHKMGNASHKDNFLSVPYSSFPFEHQARSHYSARQDKPSQAESQSSQNKLLLFIAGLLVFVASVLLILVIFG